MRSKIVITPGDDRVLLGRTGTGNHQDDYRNGSTKNLIQYSDLSLIVLLITLTMQNYFILGQKPYQSKILVI